MYVYKVCILCIHKREGQPSLSEHERILTILYQPYQLATLNNANQRKVHSQHNQPYQLWKVHEASLHITCHLKQISTKNATTITWHIVHQDLVDQTLTSVEEKGLFRIITHTKVCLSYSHFQIITFIQPREWKSHSGEFNKKLVFVLHTPTPRQLH